MAQGKEPLQGGWNQIRSGPDGDGNYTAVNVADPGNIPMKIGPKRAAEIQESSFQFAGRGQHNRDRVAVAPVNDSSSVQEISIPIARKIFNRPSKKSSR